MASSHVLRICLWVNIALGGGTDFPYFAEQDCLDASSNEIDEEGTGLRK